jgi:hypothetical protein
MATSAAENEFLIQDHDRPIISRKRRYRGDMTDRSLEESKEELIALKRVRKISPATQMHFEMMIDSCIELETLDKSSDLFKRTQLLFFRQEAVLQSRLEQDKKYSVLLEEFQILKRHQLMLRYGDYHKGNVLIFKAMSQQLAREKKIDKDVLANMTWKQVLTTIENEKNLRKAHEMSMLYKWYDNMKGKSNNFEPGDKPSSPVTDLINILSSLCKITFAHAMFEIEQYVDRNEIAHSGIDEHIADNDWQEVASIIERDIQAVRDGILGTDMELRDEMVMTLKLYKARYFTQIQTKFDKDGLMVAKHWTFSPEEIERQAAAAAAEMAREVQKLIASECAELLEKARTLEHQGWSLKTAQSKVLKTAAAMEGTSDTCKTAQSELGLAKTEHKKALLKYKKLLKGPDED